MQTKEILPADGNWLTPYLTVSDARNSLDFYERAFGFGRGNILPGPEGDIMHAEMTWQGKCVVMFSPESAASAMPMKTPAHSGVGPSLTFYVYCADVDALTDQARQAGATVLAEPEEMFWGDRMATFRDPDGYLWSFATRVGEFDMSKMPKQ
jgi:uncharacterized glyoxalase superfamily protein PhnB